MGKGGKGKGKKGKGGRKRKNQWGSDDEGEMRAGGEGENHLGASDDDGDRDVFSRGKGKGKKGKKGKGKGKKDVEEMEEEVLPEKPVKARPSFDTLLSSFGIADSESDDEQDSEGEDADEESEEEGEEQASADEAIAGDTVEAQPKDEVHGGEVDMEDEVQIDADDLVADEPGAEDGLDFFKRFWDDPPCTFSTTAKQGASSDGTTSSVKPHSFTVPGLSRCESRHRDIEPLLEELSSSSGGCVWSRCSLAPGVGKQFQEFIKKEGLEMGPRERALFLFLHSYLDVSFPVHNHLNGRAVRAACALHVVDHALKANREVLQHNSAVARAQKKGEEVDVTSIADKGFSRARVLILCPFKSVAYDFVHMMLAFCPDIKQVNNKARFEEEFRPEEGDDGKPDDSGPADWAHLFAGNSEDCFRMGMCFSKKQIRLYSPFANCDVIIASPIGLRQITGAQGDKHREFDFLSSIEVCIVDRGDALRMQNWDHVREVMQVVNCRPQGLAGIDISRLRPQFADGRARAFRQTVVSSAGEFLDADALFKLGSGSSNTALENVAKKLRSGQRKKPKRAALEEDFDSDKDAEEDEVELPMGLLTPVGGEDSSSCRGIVRLADLPSGEPLKHTSAMGIGKQFFLHVPCVSLSEQNEQLFQTFENKYWKPLGIGLERLLIVANSYYNFLRLRRFFRDEGTGFCSAFEYSKHKDLSFARQQFSSGKKRVMLVTERFLWYRRYKLKGTNYVLFFGPPETPQIYEDVLSNVRIPSQCNSMCLFTKYDGFALERIAGHERARRMLTSPPGKVFVFN